MGVTLSVSGYGVVISFLNGQPGMAALVLSFFAILIAAVLLFTLRKDVRLSGIIVIVALSLMIATSIFGSGGHYGLGYFFIFPILPLTYLVVGFRAGSTLTLLAGAGMLASLLFGRFQAPSIFSIPGVSPRVGAIVVFSVGTAMFVFARIDALFRQLARLVMLDSETGLPGRWRFEDYLGDRLRGGDDSGLEPGFALIGFRLLNYDKIVAMEGPARGETVLRTVGERVRSWNGRLEIVSRWSGSLYLAILDTNDFLELDSACRELLAILSLPVDIDGRPLSLLGTVAVTRFPDDSDDAETLIGHVLSVLDLHRNVPDELFFFDKTLHQVERYRYSLLESLAKTDFDTGLSLSYQPKIRFADGTCAGAETLLRWNHPELGPISPADFIPVAEESGNIRKLTRMLIPRAFADISSPEFARAAERNGLVIAINLSVADLMDQDLIPFLNRELLGSRIDPTWVEFEITEGVLVDDNPWIRINLENLLILGFRLAIDDFGTGYSSLSYLQRLKVHDLKIDQSFVRNLNVDAGDGTSSVIDAIISMGKSFGLEITAEGVETPAQAAYLADRGCDLAQGWLYSKSLPFGEFLQYVESRASARGD